MSLQSSLRLFAHSAAASASDPPDKRVLCALQTASAAFSRCRHYKAYKYAPSVFRYHLNNVRSANSLPRQTHANPVEPSAAQLLQVQKAPHTGPAACQAAAPSALLRSVHDSQRKPCIDFDFHAETPKHSCPTPPLAE